MITISVNPWSIDNHKIELRFTLDYYGEIFETKEIMENDWFADENIFHRVVQNAAGKLQFMYLKSKKEYKKINNEPLNR